MPNCINSASKTIPATHSGMKKADTFASIATADPHTSADSNYWQLKLRIKDITFTNMLNITTIAARGQKVSGKCKFSFFNL
jgi:hypothetical protein